MAGRQAAKTKDGQERLEALFLHYEHCNFSKNKKDFFKADTTYLKKELGFRRNRKAVFNLGMATNIHENNGSRKETKRGRKQISIPEQFS